MTRHSQSRDSRAQTDWISAIRPIQQSGCLISSSRRSEDPGLGLDPCSRGGRHRPSLGRDPRTAEIGLRMTFIGVNQEIRGSRPTCSFVFPGGKTRIECGPGSPGLREKARESVTASRGIGQRSEDPAPRKVDVPGGEDMDTLRDGIPGPLTTMDQGYFLGSLAVRGSRPKVSSTPPGGKAWPLLGPGSPDRPKGPLFVAMLMIEGRPEDPDLGKGSCSRGGRHQSFLRWGSLGRPETLSLHRSFQG